MYASTSSERKALTQYVSTPIATQYSILSASASGLSSPYGARGAHKAGPTTYTPVVYVYMLVKTVRTYVYVCMYVHVHHAPRVRARTGSGERGAGSGTSVRAGTHCV